MKPFNSFLPTGIGSLPYLDAEEACGKVFSNFKELPFWPQLPKRSYLENMYVQFSEGLPGVIVDEENKKIYIDNSKDLSEEFAKFFEDYLACDIDRFKISRKYASGFYAFAERGDFDDFDVIKTQITGPISFGLSIVDRTGRSIIYDDTFKEIILKLLEMKAKWQIRYLKDKAKEVVIFIDEPYLANFGSAFLSIERHQIIDSLNAIIDVLHQEGVKIGIHCCGNTDWSLLASTHTDIISFDSYSFSESLVLYPEEVRDFFQKGGSIAWGAVPTSEVAFNESPNLLFKRLKTQIDRLAEKDIPKELVFKNSLVTPSCGLGTLTLQLADVIIQKTLLVSNLARDKFSKDLDI